MRVLFVDHYDSFSANVLDWLLTTPEGCAETDVVTVPFDHSLLDDPSRTVSDFDRLVLSPGPGSPTDARRTQALAREWLGKKPILGICLGHQILGLLAGLRVRRALVPRHGRTKTIVVDQCSPLSSFAGPWFEAAAYHSLIVAEDSPPYDTASVTGSDAVLPRVTIEARCGAGEIMALRIHHRTAPALGWQFHPESFLTQAGVALRRYWDLPVVTGSGVG